jgi:DDE superfamily endonuclease
VAERLRGWLPLRVFRPFGALSFSTADPRLAPWAAFLRCFAAGGAARTSGARSSPTDHRSRSPSARARRIYAGAGRPVVGDIGRARAADIIALYLHPPQHAAVFCVDEKTAIQALDRLDPMLPLSPGRAERHGFEYYRHGTLSLYAALDVKTGKVKGKTAKRHTSAEFIAFLSQLLTQTRWAKEIHIVLDNLSPTKPQRWRSSWHNIRKCVSTSRPPTRPG